LTTTEEGLVSGEFWVPAQVRSSVPRYIIRSRAR
jgi:hypothetical protein